MRYINKLLCRINWQNYQQRNKLRGELLECGARKVQQQPAALTSMFFSLYFFFYSRDELRQKGGTVCTKIWFSSLFLKSKDNICQCKQVINNINNNRFNQEIEIPWQGGPTSSRLHQITRNTPKEAALSLSYSLPLNYFWEKRYKNCLLIDYFPLTLE